MGLTINLFGGDKTGNIDLARKPAVRPCPVDKTGGYPCNAETLRGLFDGTKAGLQLAAPFARPPITIPTAVVGVPTPVGSDDLTQQKINEVVSSRVAFFPANTKTKCLLGTNWIWPIYNAKIMDVVWEMIPDETIESVGINPATSEILAIWTHEVFTVATGDGQREYSERKRKITKDRIDVRWLRKGTEGTYDDASYVNVFQSMPIPFPHGANINEPRGHTVYGANLRTYKVYHDIVLNACQILAELQPKLNISTDQPGNWLANNGFGSDPAVGIPIAEANFFQSKLYLSKTGENAQMVFLSSDALKGHMDMLTNLRQSIIIGSDIPEIFWPGLAVGNMASTDIQKNNGVACIRALQTEDNDPYNRLFNKTLEILSFVDSRHYGTVQTKWGAFSLVSPEAKATIFQNMASGLGSMMNAAAVTLEDIYYFVKGIYPDLPEADADSFIKGLTATAKHSALAKADIYSMGDAANAQ